MTRHRLTWRESLASGFSLPTGHAYLAHTVEAERLARQVTVRVSMARTRRAAGALSTMAQSMAAINEKKCHVLVNVSLDCVSA